MTTKEEAARIRSEFKAAGFSSRDISVRIDCYSMGSSIDVTVRNPEAPLPWVRAVAATAENVRRCEVTGEILSGGNRFVSVRHSDEAKAALGARHREAVDAVWEPIRAGERGGVRADKDRRPMRFDKYKDPTLCVAREETRYAIPHVGVVRHNDKTWLAATDGRMLTVIAAELDDSDEVDDKVPAVFPTDAFKAARKAATRTQPEARMRVNGSAEVLTGTGAKSEFARVDDKRFPDVFGVVPKGKGAIVVGLNAAMLATIQKALGAEAIALHLTLDAKGEFDDGMPMRVEPLMTDKATRDGSLGVLMPITVGK